MHPIGCYTISIHALRKESDFPELWVREMPVLISIHALRKESDPDNTLNDGFTRRISIHALRKESDGMTVVFHHQAAYFNPRSP